MVEKFHAHPGLTVFRTEFRQLIPHSTHVQQASTSNRNVLRKMVIQGGGQSRILGNAERTECKNKNTPELRPRTPEWPEWRHLSPGATSTMSGTDKGSRSEKAHKLNCTHPARMSQWTTDTAMMRGESSWIPENVQTTGCRNQNPNELFTKIFRETVLSNAPITRPHVSVFVTKISRNRIIPRLTAPTVRPHVRKLSKGLF